MDSLDKETFSFWVTHPEELLPSDYPQLQEAISRYPYCQSLFTLAAKAASAHHKNGAIEVIRQAAARALSRNALRKLIENEFQWSEHLLNRLNELSQKHVPIPDDYEKESYSSFKSKADLNLNFPVFTFFDFAKPGSDHSVHESMIDYSSQESDVLPGEKDEAVLIADDQALTESALQNELGQQSTSEDPAEETGETANPERVRQLEIIDTFIRNEPRISPVKAKPIESSEQEDLSRRTQASLDGFVTESFAKILARQGKIEKAVGIYEKLMVKNPEKTVYFAEKIAELKEQQAK